MQPDPITQTATPPTPAAGQSTLSVNTAGELVLTDSAGLGHPSGPVGTVYVSAGNPQGWAGSDVGAWINAAYAYLIATYGTITSGATTQGYTGAGRIQIGPGVFTYTTPIVCCDQWFSVKIMGSGSGVSLSGPSANYPTIGKGGTVLNYTPTSGSAMTLGGASSNNGGVEIEDFSLFGGAVASGPVAVPGSGTAIGITWGLNQSGGVPPGSSTAGATAKDIVIAGFITGEVWNTSTQIAYAVTHINCKTQYCVTGAIPGGEGNNWFGGLFGNCTTAIAGSNAGTDANFIGTAFDDNTTTAINASVALFRGTLTGCRFENAGLGASNYITISNGSLTILGGSMQDDRTSGTGTGFVQATGGTFYLEGAWLWAGSGVTVTQAFNVSSAVVSFVATPVFAQSGSSAITSVFPANTTAVMPLIGTTNTKVNVAATAIPLTTVTNTDSRGGFPLVANVRSPLKLRCTVNCTNAATAQTTTATLRFGTANSNADTALVTLALAAGTAAVGGGKLVFEFDLISATTAVGSIVFDNGVNATAVPPAAPVATGMSACPHSSQTTSAVATVATTSATFVGCYLSSATAAAVTVRSVAWEVIG